MNFNIFLQDAKAALRQFPDFIKNMIRTPFQNIDQEPMINLTHVAVFLFLTEVAVNLAKAILTLRFSGIANFIIFDPIRILILTAFISAILWFILSKMGFLFSFEKTFKLIAMTEIAIVTFFLPLMVIRFYLKIPEFSYAVDAGFILGKAYVAYRGLNRQFLLTDKKSFWLVSIFSVIFLAPIVFDFAAGFQTRQEIRQAKRMHEKLMEKSIQEIEKDLSTSNQ